MPRSVNLSAADKKWLKNNHTTQSYTAMANRIGCCTDTLKRILVRMKLRDFDGAKYQVRRDAETQLWSRPCLSCGADEPRPKNHYFCPACRRQLGYEE